MLPPVPEEREPDDGLVVATRVVELVGLVLYCAVLWQLLAPEPTALSRWWARARPRLARVADRALVPWRARQMAPYVVWEAMEIVREP